MYFFLKMLSKTVMKASKTRQLLFVIRFFGVIKDLLRYGRNTSPFIKHSYVPNWNVWVCSCHITLKLIMVLTIFGCSVHF